MIQEVGNASMGALQLTTMGKETTLEKRCKGKTRKPKFPWGIALEMPRGTTMRCCHATPKRPKARGNEVET